MTSVGFSPDGASIVSGSFDKTIKVWELKTVQKTKKNWRGKTIKVWDAGTLARHFLTQPKAKRPHACYSFPEAQGGEAERAQRLGVLRGLFPRWRHHCVGLKGRDDQSLGCRHTLARHVYHPAQS